MKTKLLFSFIFLFSLIFNVLLSQTPVSPTRLSISDVNCACTSCKLTWDHSPGAGSYIVYIYKNSFKDMVSELIATKGAGPYNYITISGLATIDLISPSSYTFRVQACNGMGCSVQSSGVNLYRSSAKPSTPLNLVATKLNCTDVNVSWNASSGQPTGYNIYENNILKASTTGTNYRLTNLKSSIYNYKVEAFNTCGTSSSSSESSVTIDLPGPVTNLTWHQFGSAYVLLWNMPISGPVHHYGVYQNYPTGTNYGPIYPTNFGLSGLAPSSMYVFTVTAINSDGCSSTGVTTGFSVKSAKYDENDNLDNESQKLEVLVSTSDNVIIVSGALSFNATIFDISGKKVFENIILNGFVNIASLKQGIYVLHIKSEGNTLIKKFVKQ